MIELLNKNLEKYKSKNEDVIVKLIHDGYGEYIYNCLRELYTVVLNAKLIKQGETSYGCYVSNESIENFVAQFNIVASQIPSEVISRDLLIALVTENYILSATEEEWSKRVGVADPKDLYTKHVGYYINMNELPSEIIDTIREKLKNSQ